MLVRMKGAYLLYALLWNITLLSKQGVHTTDHFLSQFQFFIQRCTGLFNTLAICSSRINNVKVII